MQYNYGFSDKSHIKYEILAYLSEHPEAQDTLKGVIQWWLLKSNINYQPFMVKESLNELVKQDLLLEKKRSGIEPLYVINIKKIKEIKKYLTIFKR